MGLSGTPSGSFNFVADGDIGGVEKLLGDRGKVSPLAVNSYGSVYRVTFNGDQAFGAAL